MSVVVEGAPADANWATNIALARAYYRSLIGAPTGEGATLGGAIYNGDVYVMRNDAGGATATLWKSSSSGWSAVRAGLRAGGTLRTAKGAFTGSPGSAALYGVDGKNRLWELKGSTFTFAPSIYASEGVSTTSLTPGLGSTTFGTDSGRVFVTGQEMIAYSPTDAATFMIGAVTASTGSSVTLDVASFGGSTNAAWHLCRTDGVDRPYVVAAHKNHLFNGYPLGQLQHSNLGDPLTYTTTAGVIGLGDEIVDLKTLRADSLCVTQQGRVSLVYGSDKATWELKQHSESSGARAGSTQEVAGNGIYLNDAGIISMAGSQAFGDFEAANVARDAMASLRRIVAGYRCVALSKADSQYRVYGQGNQVLVMAFAGGSVSPRSVAFTKLRYEHQAVWATSDVIDGEEYIVFGTDDGLVMRDRIGTTFDGEDISAFIRTSYWHHGNPQQRKRMRKVTIDCDTEAPQTISFKLDFDFAGPDVASAINVEVMAAGGYWDDAYWNEFFWSSADTAQLEANVDGIGRHISMWLWTLGDSEPYRVYGMASQFSPIRITR